MLNISILFECKCTKFYTTTSVLSCYKDFIYQMFLRNFATQVLKIMFMSEESLVLRTENLVKKYGQRTVANHVSINVRQGEIVGLLGPNGAGKTTTFYMTTGLVIPNEGKIFLNDLDITSYPVYKRAQNGIGYLAQEASVFRKMTVEDNIRAALEMTHTTKEFQKDKLESQIGRAHV